MRLRFLFLLGVISILLAAGSIARKFPVKAQASATKSVWIGGAVFSPSSISPTGSSTLIVSVATGAEVPAQGADGTSSINAIVQVSENSNASGITYTVDSHLATVSLMGGVYLPAVSLPSLWTLKTRGAGPSLIMRR